MSIQRGKRYDWLSPSTDWDISRDQIARNLEACWSLGEKAGKDYLLLICHERELKHHEACLCKAIVWHVVCWLASHSEGTTFEIWSSHRNLDLAGNRAGMAGLADASRTE